MTTDLGDLAGALQVWLAERMDADNVTVSGVTRATAGQSNETVLFDVSANGDVERMVLRRQAVGTTIFRNPDALREARVLQGLTAAGVRVPQVRWTEPEPSVLGAPFFVMELIEGRVPLGKPSIHSVGWLPTLTRIERDRLWSSALDTMISVHAVAWRSSHHFLLDGDAKAATVGAHVSALADWYRWSTAQRDYPITDAAVEYLQEHLAEVDSGESVLLWGDPRVGNMIFGDDNTVAAALDWETASIGPVERDVAHWLFFDEFQTEAAGVERLPGWPDRETTVAALRSQVGSSPQASRVLRCHGDTLHGHDPDPPGRSPGRTRACAAREPHGTRQHGDPDARQETEPPGPTAVGRLHGASDRGRREGPVVTRSPRPCHRPLMEALPSWSPHTRGRSVRLQGAVRLSARRRRRT